MEDEEREYFYKTFNRTTTTASLWACLRMLTAKTKEEFCFYYEQGVFSKSAAKTWYCMNQVSTNSIERYWQKWEKKHLGTVTATVKKRHWCTNGVENRIESELPEGYHWGKVGNWKNQFGECK